jgi:hypothetical protein
LLFVAAVIPSRKAPQTTCLTHAPLYCSLIESSFANVDLQLEGAVYFWLVLIMINLLF